MKIEAVDFFYCAIPEVKNIGDGSQDALLVRVQGDGHTGWGECEAAPLVSIANWICPMSHSACRPVIDAVAGQTVEGPEDIARIHREVKALGLDIAQTDHTLSGIDIALWDWLGKRLETPVYKLLGYTESHARDPYASQLFGDNPEATFSKAEESRASGFRAVKFGWGPFGLGSAEADIQHLEAAREGLGADIQLLVDVGTVWLDDVSKALPRVAAMEAANLVWLEEPFIGEAHGSYLELSKAFKTVKLAGGEGASTAYAAKHLIDHGGIGFIQIDTGRIGGISAAKEVADYALTKGVQFVNHTFTTHLALSASLQAYAGHPGNLICEYPVEPSILAQTLSHNQLERDADGLVNLSERPGLGIDVNIETVKKYLQDVRIEVNGKRLYESPTL